MTKLKPAEIFTATIALGTISLAIYLIGKMTVGGANCVSSTELQFMSLLTLVNYVNIIHWPVK